jgi:hypothetical protein
MTLIEQLASSLREEGRGIHALLWTDLGDLYRVLLITHAALGEMPIQPLLISNEATRIKELNDLIQARLRDQVEYDGQQGQAADSFPFPHPLWVLFFQQAVSKQVGPRLNGWRRPLSEPRGTLLVVRFADFIEFQRNAPDLSSFIGPRIYDASRMMMVCSRETLGKLKKDLPEPFESIIRQLPGTPPSAEEIADWTPLPFADEG